MRAFPSPGCRSAASSIPCLSGSRPASSSASRPGVFGFTWLAVRVGLAERPAGATGRQVCGVAVPCGIGFTMSLFIALLAFLDEPALADASKLGILAGSLLPAGLGAALLSGASRARTPSSRGLSAGKRYDTGRRRTAGSGARGER